MYCSVSMKIFAWFLAASLALLPVSGSRLQEQKAPAAQAAPDWTTLDGKFLRDVNPDDARLLGIVARGALYEAQKGGTLTPEKAKLAALTAQALARQDLNSAFRYAARAIILLQGGRISEGSELATSFDFKLNRKLFAPGEPLAISLEPLFAPGAPLSAPHTARLSVRSGSSEPIEPVASIKIQKFQFYLVSLPTEKLQPGKYSVQYELLSPEGRPLVSASREFLVNSDAKPRLAAVRKKLDTLKSEDIVSRGFQHATAVETVEYIVEDLQRATREYVAAMTRNLHPMVARIVGANLTRFGSEPFDIEKDLGLAEELAAALLAGKNPLASRAGDLRLAYRSDVDGSLQPFRVFVPEGYTPAKKFPLIVALHGATGDENTYMDRYLAPTGENLFRKLAQERGYILATPNGRGPFGGYTGNAEKDVLDVLDRVQKVYSIHPREVFLTGHSMGAMGTWQLGFKHAAKFAALAPVAGFRNMEIVPFQNAPHMPVLYSQGTKDVLATPEEARKVVELVRKQLADFTYKEYPDDHLVIGVTSMPAIFDFFDVHRSPSRPAP